MLRYLHLPGVFHTHTHTHTNDGLFVLSGNVAGELPEMQPGTNISADLFVLYWQC